MSSSYSPNSTPLKSKNSLNLESNSPVSNTPEKYASQPQNGARNHVVAFSIEEIRQVAQSQPHPPTDHDKSARKHILSWATESPSPKTSVEKYEILSGFFDSLDSAIRLLKLKGLMPTFANISPKVECLTYRKFSYGHLAQLKHILPKAIQIERMLIFDERASCMKPDLCISIIVNAIDFGDKSEPETKNLNLRRVFRARLAKYLEAFPEGGEIPEEDLPEPFNHSKQDKLLNMIKGPTSLSSDESSTYTLTEQQPFTARVEAIQEEAPSRPSNHSNFNSELAVETLVDVVNDQQPVVASHVSRSFRKCFSQKATSKAQEVVLKCSKFSPQSSNFQAPELCADRYACIDETRSAPTLSPIKFLSKSNTNETSSTTFLLATPVKEINPLKSEDDSPIKAGSVQSTPAKLASIPGRLMTATPALQPQKRCYMSPDEASSIVSNKLVRQPLIARSLKFDTPVNEEKVVDKVHEMAGKTVDNDEDDILSILSIREKKRKAMKEQDPAISKAKRRQWMIACLPQLFNMIHYLFQSIKCSFITKEELVHKIIAGHCDIADRGEAEEQLKLLQELAPEWISEKMASAGDLLVCINKVSSLESIRMRLQEVKWVENECLVSLNYI